MVTRVMSRIIKQMVIRLSSDGHWIIDGHQILIGWWLDSHLAEFLKTDRIENKTQTPWHNLSCMSYSLFSERKSKGLAYLPPWKIQWQSQPSPIQRNKSLGIRSTGWRRFDVDCCRLECETPTYMQWEVHCWTIQQKLLGNLGFTTNQVWWRLSLLRQQCCHRWWNL